MRSTTIIVAITTAAVLLSTGLFNTFDTEKKSEIRPSIHTLYSKWKVKYGALRMTPSENNFRIKVFYKNYLEVLEVRAAMPSAKFAMNQFSDMTNEEKAASLHGYSPATVEDETVDKLEEPEPLEEGLTLPGTWIARNVYSPGHQQRCNSCWAWSAKHVTETLVGGGVRISAQNIMNCRTNGDGCNPAGLNTGLDVIKNYGYKSESEVPYRASNSWCGGQSRKTIRRSVGIVRAYSADQIKNELYKSKAAAVTGVNALGTVWYNFAGGIMENTNSACTSSSGNHAVTLIGWNGGRNTWAIKNSWGTGWGNGGFIDIRIDPTMKGSCFCGDLRNCQIDLWR